MKKCKNNYYLTFFCFNIFKINEIFVNNSSRRKCFKSHATLYDFEQLCIEQRMFQKPDEYDDMMI